MSLMLEIDREDNRPIYQQIVAQIKQRISTGKLPPGTRLPAVRQMAQALNVNRLTVHNAYSELQADGWVESTVGRGTFVIKPAQATALISSIGAQFSPDSVLRDIYPIHQIPTLRSLAYTEPDIALAPVDEILGGIGALRHANPASIMRYDSPQGDPALRVEITALLRERGIEVTPDEVVITSGAIQALSLAARALIQPGDTVLVEEPTYLGFIHTLQMSGVQVIPVSFVEGDLDTEGLRQAIIQHHPRFFYTVSSFQNPTGYSMSSESRRELMSLAGQYQMTIIEDDVYGLLAYDAPPPPTLKSMDTTGLVIYISSLSKVLIPGLRVGWMVAPPDVQECVLTLRRATDMCGPGFLQRGIANYLGDGRLKSHLRRMLPIYRARRDALMQAFRRYMPPGVAWTKPLGGFSSWVTLPQRNMDKVYHAALERNLALTPGDAFLIQPQNRHFRVCFGCAPENEIHELIALFGDVIKHHRLQAEVET